MADRNCNAMAGASKAACFARLHSSALVGAFWASLFIPLSGALLAFPVQAAQLRPSEEAAQAYEQAMKALAAGEQERAELLLERVLMLSPENAEARLELASLFAMRGRLVSARLLLESLASDPRTPEAHKSKLRGLSDELSLVQESQLGKQQDTSSNVQKDVQKDAQKDIKGAPTAKREAQAYALKLSLSPALAAALSAPPSTRVEVGASSSSNPMARTGSEGITFTLPEGPVQLPLSVKPLRGVAKALQVSHAFSQFRDAGAELYVQSLQTASVITPSAPSGPGPALGTALEPAPIAGLNTGASSAVNSPVSTGLSSAPQADPKTALRLSTWGTLPTAFESVGSLQWHYQAQQGLDGLRRHSLSVAKPFDWSGLAWRGVAVLYQEPSTLERQGDKGQALRIEHKGLSGPWSWLAHAERSNSQTFEQGYLRAGVHAEVRLWPQGTLSWQTSDQKDTHGYSPLLENGAKRRLFSSNVAFEQQHRFENEKVLIFRAFSAERRSNLELFNYKDVGVQIMLRSLL